MSESTDCVSGGAEKKEEEKGTAVAPATHPDRKRPVSAEGERVPKRMKATREFVLVVSIGEEEDACCVVKIPREELSADHVNVLHSVAGTYCFEEEALSTDVTGLLPTLYRVLGGSKKDLDERTRARVMPHSTWRLYEPDKGRVLDAGEVAVECVVIGSSV